MKNGIAVRAAAPSDLEALITLYVRGWQQAYAGLLDSHFLQDLPHNPRSRDYLANLLGGNRADAVVLVAEANGTPLGFVAAGHTRDKQSPSMAEVYAIYITPARQQQNIGRLLFESCIANLRQKGFKTLHIWTFAANTPARRAYQKWGGAPGNTTRTVLVGGDQLQEVGFDWAL